MLTLAVVTLYSNFSGNTFVRFAFASFSFMDRPVVDVDLSFVLLLHVSSVLSSDLPAANSAMVGSVG